MKFLFTIMAYMLLLLSGAESRARFSMPRVRTISTTTRRVYSPSTSYHYHSYVPIFLPLHTYHEPTTMIVNQDGYVYTVHPHGIYTAGSWVASFIIIGIVFVLTLIVCLAFCCFCRSRNQPHLHPSPHLVEEHTTVTHVIEDEPLPQH